MPRWYNVELDKDEAEQFEQFCRDIGVKYEPSACYNLIHIEVYIVTDEEYQACEDFLCTL